MRRICSRLFGLFSERVVALNGRLQDGKIFCVTGVSKGVSSWYCHIVFARLGVLGSVEPMARGRRSRHPGVSHCVAITPFTNRFSPNERDPSTGAG
jgi:hypothetical protein